MFRPLLIFCATVFIFPCAGAQEQYISLHQFSKRLSLSYKSDGSVNFIDNLSGIKNLYDPTGVVGGGAPACVLGVPQFSSKCSLVAGSIGGGIIGTFDLYKQYKFYFPAGSISAGLFAAMPQSTQYATVARMGTPPTRATPLTSAEYQDRKSRMDLNIDFNRLLAGQEVIMVHDGSGNINPTGNGRFETHPMLKGYWVYVRVLNNDYVTNLSGATGLDLDIYTDWYKGMIASNGFKSDGDPQDVISTPVRPAGIKLTTNVTVPGSIVGIQPQNSDAVIIGRCSIEPPAIAEQDIPAGKTLTGVTVFRYKVSVASNAVQGQYKVKCGDATDYSSQYAQYTPKFEALLNVQDTVPPPVYTLNLSASSISLDDPKSVKVTRSDGGDVGNCTFSSSEQSFAPTSYVQWDPTKKEISLRTDAPALSGNKQVSVTCSSSTSPITFELKAKTPSVASSVLGFKSSADTSNSRELRLTYGRKTELNEFPDAFNCQSNDLVSYDNGSNQINRKITLKENVSLSSALVLRELVCGAGTSNWKADFYLSLDSAGKISLHASEPQNITLKSETTTDGFVKLNVVVPKRTTDSGILTVWFGAKVPVESAQSDLWFWLVKTDGNSPWLFGEPDTKPGTGLNITPVQGKDNEFSFVLPIFKQAELAAYQVGGRKIEGTVYYRFGSGELRKLSAVWKP